MMKKNSQRKATLLVLGVIALGYLVNFVIFSLPDGSPQQYAAAGSLLVAAGAAWVWLVGRPTTLRLDRARNTCRLVRPRFFIGSGTDETFPLERVSGVRVREVTLSSHDGPDSTGYEVSIETKDGRAYVFSTEDSRPGGERLAARVRALLEGGEPSTLRRHSWMMLAVGGAFVLCGLLVIIIGAATG